MRKPYTFLLLLFLFPLFVFANNPDSLFNVWQNEQLQPEIRGEALNQFVQKGFVFQNPDSSLILLDKLEQFANTNELLPLIASLNRNRGVCWAVKGNNDKAIEFFTVAKEKFEEVGDKKMAARSSANVATIYTNIGKFDEALAIYQNIMDSPAINEKSIGQLVYSNIGTLYNYKNNYLKSIHYLNKSYDLLSDNANPGTKAILLGNIANNYIAIDEYDIGERKIREALELNPGANSEIALYNSLATIYIRHQKDTIKGLSYLEKSLTLIEGNQLFSNAIGTYPNMANIYFERGEYKKSKQSANQLIKLLGEDSNSRLVVDMLILIGKIHFAEKQIAKAKNFCNRGLDIGKKEEFHNQIVEACNCLATISESEGNYKKAFEYSTIQNEFIEKATENEHGKEITKVAMNYEFENEKKLIALEQEKKESLLIATNKQTRTAALGIGAFALLALGFFWNARRKNQLISAQNEQLESLNHTKDRIFAIIGHDLRKPAASFRGISKKVKYLIKKQDFETLDKYGQQIEQNALSLNKLTDNLLNWALTQRDVMPYNPATINLNDIALDVQTIFSTTASEKNIEIINNVPQGIKVYADPNALSAILTNLVDNAIKYTPEGGQVRIEALEEANNQLKIRVSDTGIGMHQDRINDLFLLKKDKSEKGTSGEKGTGLGLHLVKELVELNKGIISAASEIGKGTSFEVLLPKIATV